MRHTGTCFLASLGLVLALTGGAVAQPQKSGQPYGYWAVNTAPDGIKLGVIFPEFSPNDFAGVVFLCTPGTSTVSVSVDSPRPMRAGTKAAATIVADGVRTSITGTAERSEMDDQTRVIFSTTLSDPVLATLAGARDIRFGLGQSLRPLPNTGAAKAVPEFLKKCASGSDAE